MGFKGKKVTSIISLLLAVLFFTTGLLTAGGLPCEILIDNEGYEKKLRSPVPFDHQKHSGEHNISCNACHHEYRDGKNIWTNCMEVQRCISCHDPISKQGDVDRLHIAYHKSCRSCHQDMGNDRIAPFRQCIGCHK